MFENFKAISEFAKYDDTEQMIQKIRLDRIKEDPSQPRKDGNKGFSEESLRELANSIKEIGLKQPISVREDGENYIINHGARRYRATQMLGEEKILAYIDNEYSDYAQVVENIQRENLSPREIADFIGMQIAKGFKQKDIAQKIGKSPAWVGQYKTLLDLPSKLAKSFGEIKNITDVTSINLLMTAYDEHAQEIDDFLDDNATEKHISRTMIEGFLESLKDRERYKETQSPVSDSETLDGAETNGGDQLAQETEETTSVGASKAYVESVAENKASENAISNNGYVQRQSVGATQSGYRKQIDNGYGEINDAGESDGLDESDEMDDDENDSMD